MMVSVAMIFGGRRSCFMAAHKSFLLTVRHESSEQCRIHLGNESEIIISFGKLAKFADGSATVKLGDTTILATAVTGSSAESSQNFLPLTVNYKQKAAALGRIPTNFLRRELAPSDHEILTSRVIDRSIRPLFPKNFKQPVEVVCSPLAMDGVTHPDVLAVNAASVALSLSSIPWDGPIGAVRVGCVDSGFCVNPSKKQLVKSSLNLIVSGTQSQIVMVEGFADNLSYYQVLQAIKFGQRYCKMISTSIKELALRCGKKKMDHIEIPTTEKFPEQLSDFLTAEFRRIFTTYKYDKVSRDAEIFRVRSELKDKAYASFPHLSPNQLEEEFSNICKMIFRKVIFEKELRCDGRKLSEVRPISCEVSLYEPLHGSSMFQRGQTQVMCSVTLDSPNSALKLDPVSVLLSGVKSKNFFLHYEFPPFATNELGGERRASRRREIGHGELAERGLKCLLPSDFEFTIRLSSEVMESNGSSSMATVCAGSMALMDAGVPISAPAAGVAIGLITESRSIRNPEFRILTDILGIEDYLGDMDMKVAGTSTGLTAIQVDLKIPGINKTMMACALKEAQKGICFILNKMNQVITHPRTDKNGKRPIIKDILIPVHKKANVFGLGGMNIKLIEAETGMQVVAYTDSGFTMYAPNQEALEEAEEAINQLLLGTTEPQMEFGAIYKAKVVDIIDAGCMIKLHDNMRPVLLPNTQLDMRKVNHASALGITVGQVLTVKYFGRDPATGKVRISRKILQTTAPDVVRSHFEEN